MLLFRLLTLFHYAGFSASTVLLSHHADSAMLPAFTPTMTTRYYAATPFSPRRLPFYAYAATMPLSRCRCYAMPRAMPLPLAARYAACFAARYSARRCVVLRVRESDVMRYMRNMP